VSAGGLHTDWKKRAQVQPPLIAATTESNTKAIARQTRANPHPSITLSTTVTASSMAASRKSHASGLNQVLAHQVSADPAGATRQVDGGGSGELGVDENDETLKAVRKDKQALGGAKKIHKGGTNAVWSVFALKSGANVLLDGN
jgi:hypothetical protein